MKEILETTVSNYLKPNFSSGFYASSEIMKQKSPERKFQEVKNTQDMLSDPIQDGTSCDFMNVRKIQILSQL